MGDSPSREFINFAKYEHRICPDKCIMGQAQVLVTNRKSKHTEEILYVCSFSVCFKFRVMRLASLAVMSLPRQAL